MLKRPRLETSPSDSTTATCKLATNMVRLAIARPSTAHRSIALLFIAHPSPARLRCTARPLCIALPSRALLLFTARPSPARLTTATIPSTRNIPMVVATVAKAAATAARQPSANEMPANSSIAKP